MSQSGSIKTLLIIVVIMLVGAGSYYIGIRKTTARLPASSLSPSPSPYDTSTPSPTQVSDKMRVCLEKLSTYNEYASSQIIVSFRNDVSFSRIQAILKDFNIELSESDKNRIEAHTFIVVKTPEGTEKELSCKLNELFEVEYAELNGKVYIQ